MLILDVIQDPDFFHPGSRVQQYQKRGKKKSVVLLVFVAINFTKFKVIFTVEQVQKKV
jgi:hypothetical protein